MPTGSFLERLRSLLGGSGGNASSQSPAARGFNPGPSAGAPTAVPRHSPGVLTGSGEAPSWQAKKDEPEILAFAEECFKQASQARRIHEGRYLTNWAYYQSEQYSYYDAASGDLKQYKDNDPNPWRTWAVHNKIAPKIDLLIARTMESHLETTVTAFSEAPQDVAYAGSLRGVLEDVAVRANFDMQNLEIIRGTHIIGPMFTKLYVNTSLPILRPLLDESGQMASYIEEKSGAICRGVFGWEEAYPDPRSDDPERWQYFIHAQELTIEEIRATFPGRGKYIVAGSHGGSDAEFDSAQRRLDTVNNDTTKDTSRKSVALVKEMWLLPQPGKGSDWPEGLVCWWCNGVVLWSGPWLYPSLKKLPFSQYVHQRSYGTPWAHAPMDRVRSIQDSYNDMVSALLDRAKEGPKIIGATGLGVRPDQFRRGRPHEYIPVNDFAPGKIQYLNPPPIEGAVIQALQVADSDIGQGLQVDPVSEGKAPAGVTAAAAIQSLESFNRAASAIPIEFYRLAQRRDMEIIEQIARDLHSGQAVMALRESAMKVGGNEGDGQGLSRTLELLGAMGASSQEYALALSHEPDDKLQGRSQTVNLDALSGGGRATIDVLATAPKNPVQRQRELMEMMNSPMFKGEDLETGIAFLELMQVEDYDKARARLIRVLTSRQAKAQQMMEQAQAAQGEATQLEEQKLQQATEGKQMETEARLQENAERSATQIEIAKIGAATQLQIALINAGKASATTDAPMGEDGAAPAPMPTDTPITAEEPEYDLPEPLTAESFDAIALALESTQESGLETQYPQPLSEEFAEASEPPEPLMHPDYQ